MEPQALIDFGSGPSHRTLAGHFFALGVYVFIFGALAYLAFLNHGGIAGQLLLIYVSSIPLAFAIGTVVEIARAEKRLAAHHVLAGCLNAVVLCGVGGIWLAFKEQLILMLLGSLTLVWLTRYSPAAQYLQPPGLSDVAATTPLSEHRTARTLATVAGATALLIGGLGLTLLAAFGQMQRPGGINITLGG